MKQVVSTQPMFGSSRNAPFRKVTQPGRLYVFINMPQNSSGRGLRNPVRWELHCSYVI